MRVFEAENGEKIIALNDIQAAAFIKAGLNEVKEPKKK